MKTFEMREEMRKDDGKAGKFLNYIIILYLLYKSPGQTLQHLPGSCTGSSHVAFGHSLLIFRHWTLATILLRLVTCNKNNVKLLA